MGYGSWRLAAFSAGERAKWVEGLRQVANEAGAGVGDALDPNATMGDSGGDAPSAGGGGRSTGLRAPRNALVIRASKKRRPGIVRRPSRASFSASDAHAMLALAGGVGVKGRRRRGSVSHSAAGEAGLLAAFSRLGSSSESLTGFAMGTPMVVLVNVLEGHGFHHPATRIEIDVSSIAVTVSALGLPPKAVRSDPAGRPWRSSLSFEGTKGRWWCHICVRGLRACLVLCSRRWPRASHRR